LVLGAELDVAWGKASAVELDMALVEEWAEVLGGVSVEALGVALPAHGDGALHQ
jgi:hypothetical protein